MRDHQLVERLRTAGVRDAFARDSPRYAAAMGRLFTLQAASRRPLILVQPSSRGEVAAVIRAAREEGLAVTTRGGGLSTLCAADGAILLDLSAHMGEVAVVADGVQAGGGVTMGQINARLAGINRFLPVGVAALPGLGLATQGGIGG